MVYNGFFNKSVDPHTYITPTNFQALALATLDGAIEKEIPVFNRLKKGS